MGFPDQPEERGGARSEQPGVSQPGTGQPRTGQPGAGQPGAGQPGVRQGYGGYPPAGYQGGGPGRTNGMSVAALVCGFAQFLLWIFLLVPGFIAALLALIFGLVGLAQTRTRGEGGRGMAVTGIVLGALGVLGGIIWAILLSVGSTHFHYHTGT